MEGLFARMMQHSGALFQRNEDLEARAGAGLGAAQQGAAPLREDLAHHREPQPLVLGALGARARAERILGTLDAVAEELSTTPAAVALAWLLHKPGVTSVLFGARTLGQLEDNLRAAELALSAEQVAALDEASAFPLGYPYEFMKRIQGRW